MYNLLSVGTLIEGIKCKDGLHPFYSSFQSFGNYRNVFKWSFVDTTPDPSSVICVCNKNTLNLKCYAPLTTDRTC